MPAAEGALTPGEALGGAAEVALFGIEMLAVGVEAPQPAVSVAARRSVTWFRRTFGDDSVHR